MPVNYTRLVVCAVPDPAAIQGIKDRFLPLPTTCRKGGKAYVQAVRIREGISKQATAKPDYNLVIELDFASEEDFEYFAEHDEVHLAAVSWAKPYMDALVRLSIGQGLKESI